MAGADDIDEQSSPTAYVSESYTPVGARAVHVSSTAGFGVGDLVVVRRLSNATWVASIGMDAIASCTPPAPGRSCSQWDG